MLSKKNRLGTKFFKDVFKRGKISPSSSFLLKITSTSLEKPVFSFVVSSKTAKKAVDRNKLKRRASYIIRKMIPEFKKQNFGAIFIFNTNALKIGFQALKDEIEKSMKKLGVL